MNPSDIETFLNDLTTKLTPAGQQVFAWAVRNEIISSAIAVILGVLLSLLGLTALVVAIRSARAPGFDADGDAGFLVALVVAVSVVVLLAGVILIVISLPVLLNPEWYALRDILAQVPKP